MSEFVLQKERFKFGILDKVPIAKSDECILLYQERQGENGSIIIDSFNKAFTSDIRRGKFNTKVCISLRGCKYCDALNLKMSDYDFFFQVSIQIVYAVKDVRGYYFRDNAESEELVKKDIRKILIQNDKTWNIHAANDLKKSLQQELETCLQKYPSLKFSQLVIEVSPDADAARIIESDKEKDIQIYTQGNRTDIELAEKENKGKILDSEHEIRMKKVDHLTQLVEYFGELAPVVAEHLNEKMDGKELYEYIEKKRKEDREFVLGMGATDIITDERINKILDSVTGKGNFVQMEDKKKIEGGKVSQIEQKDDEEQVIEDGDYL